jgi:hypothetical protein
MHRRKKIRTLVKQTFTTEVRVEDVIGFFTASSPFESDVN